MHYEPDLRRVCRKLRYRGHQTTRHAGAYACVRGEDYEIVIWPGGGYTISGNAVAALAAMEACNEPGLRWEVTE